MNKTIKKVTTDLDTLKYNTAVSSLMILLNELEKLDNITTKDYRTLLLLLNPMAPHITEELNEKYDLDIPTDDFDTIGGYVFGLLGREPEIGDIIEDRNISYKVLELDGIRISRLEMKKDTPFVEFEKEAVSETEQAGLENEEV